MLDEKKNFDFYKLNDPEKAEKYFASKLTFTLGPFELNKAIHNNDKFNIVDVRLPEDYARGHIPGSKNLPEKNWDSTLILSKDKINIFYCYSQQCHLASRAAYQFSKLNYQVMELEGGFDVWKNSGFNIEL